MIQNKIHQIDFDKNINRILKNSVCILFVFC